MTSASYQNPVNARPRSIAAVSLLLVLAVLAWCLFGVEDSLAGLLLSAATVIGTLASLIAGNTYALRSWRQRIGQMYKGRPKQEWPPLPPQETIQLRMRGAAAGLLVACIGLIVAGIVAGSAETDALIAMMGGFVAMVAVLIAGTLLPPLDPGLIRQT